MNNKLNEDMQEADRKFQENYNKLLDERLNKETINVYRLNPEDSKEQQEKTLDSILGNMTQTEFKVGERVLTEEQLLLAINFLAKD